MGRVRSPSVRYEPPKAGNEIADAFSLFFDRACIFSAFPFPACLHALSPRMGAKPVNATFFVSVQAAPACATKGTARCRFWIACCCQLARKKTFLDLGPMKMKRWQKKSCQPKQTSTYTLAANVFHLVHSPTEKTNNDMD